MHLLIRLQREIPRNPDPTPDSYVLEVIATDAGDLAVPESARQCDQARIIDEPQNCKPHDGMPRSTAHHLQLYR
jgi:hypothetical protein